MECGKLFARGRIKGSNPLNDKELRHIALRRY
jgi:hypothetical protein